MSIHGPDRKNLATCSHARLLGASLFSILVLTVCSFEIPGTGQTEKPWTDVIPDNFNFMTARVVDFNLEIDVRMDGITQAYSGEIGAYSPSVDGSYSLLGSTYLSPEVGGEVRFLVLVPTSLRSITIRPSTFGLFEHEVALDSGTSSVDLHIIPYEAPVSASRGLADNGFRALVPAGSAGFQSVSGFDALGRPTGLLLPSESFSQGFLDDITATLPEYRSMPNSNPAVLDVAGRSNLSPNADSDVVVTFISEGASHRNSLGYFVFESGKPPATPPASSDIVMVFPNASFYGSGGGLQAGDRIKLINPADGTTVFKANTSIGWVIITDGWTGNSVSGGLARYYSISSLNPETGTPVAKTHVALLHYDKPAKHRGNVYLIGFEDFNREVSDNDFNDLIFSVSVNPTESIDPTDIPEAVEAVDSDGDGILDHNDDFPEDPLRSRTSSWPSATTYGTALFEDRWPSIGDYDFNDIVANIRTTTVKNGAGQAVEMFVDIRLRAAGGGLPSGLALAIPVAASDILSVTGQSLSGDLFTPDLNGVEEDGAASVLPIFSDSHSEFGVAGSGNLLVNTVTGSPDRPELAYQLAISFRSGVDADSLITSPDVFVVVDGDRSKEIHAIGKLPGRKANKNLFNTRDDGSSVSDGLYYRSTKGAPWALLVAAEIPWVIELTEFSKAYPKFPAWVRSRGTQFADWYFDKPGYRDESYLR